MLGSGFTYYPLGMKTKAMLILTLLTFLQAQAQQANQFHSWWVYEGAYKVHERLTLKPIYAFSRNDFVKNWQQSLLGLGFSYDFKSHVTFGGGYEWIERFPYGEQPIPHQITIHRFYQNVTFSHHVGRLRITNLLRWNQEYVNQEARYFIINQIGLSIPLILKGDIARISMKLSEGIFINHGEWANKSYFGQNRAFAGLNFLVVKNLGLDLGYLNHYIVKQSDMIENNHTLFIKITQSLAFNKRF